MREELNVFSLFEAVRRERYACAGRFGTRGQYIRIAAGSEQSPEAPIFTFTDSVLNPYAGAAMWYVNRSYSISLQWNRFRPRVFWCAIRAEWCASRNTIAAESCARHRRAAFQMTEIPCIMMQGQFTTLWDAGMLSEISDRS